MSYDVHAFDYQHGLAEPEASPEPGEGSDPYLPQSERNRIEAEIILGGFAILDEQLRTKLREGGRVTTRLERLSVNLPITVTFGGNKQRKARSLNQGWIDPRTF